MSFRLAAVALACGVLNACALPPRVDAYTPYVGNVSPLEYQHVSGAPVRRNATAEVAALAAGAAGSAAGQLAAGGAVAVSPAVIAQSSAYGSADGPGRVVDGCAPIGWTTEGSR